MRAAVPMESKTRTPYSPPWNPNRAWTISLKTVVAWAG